MFNANDMPHATLSYSAFFPLTPSRLENGALFSSKVSDSLKMISEQLLPRKPPTFPFSLAPLLHGVASKHKTLIRVKTQCCNWRCNWRLCVASWWVASWRCCQGKLTVHAAKPCTWQREGGKRREGRKVIM